MFTLALASILHYFDIFTFHTAHYWSVLLMEIVIYGIIEKIKRYND